MQARGAAARMTLSLSPATVLAGREICFAVLDPGHKRGPLGVKEDEFGTGGMVGVPQPNARGAYRPLKAVLVSTETTLTPSGRGLELGQR